MGVPLWEKVLKGDAYTGIGPVMAAVIYSEIDIHKADTPSKIWSFAGLSTVPALRCKICQDLVVKNGDGFKHRYVRQKKCAVKNADLGLDVVVESRSRQFPIKGEKLSYNKFLKTKVVEVMTGCILRSGSPLRRFYDDYKLRKQSEGWGMSDGHRHRAALRYLAKMVLLSIWREWRQLEGLPVRDSYQEEYLGHRHGGDQLSAEI